jgi:hypothetical protein
MDSRLPIRSELGEISINKNRRNKKCHRTGKAMYESQEEARKFIIKMNTGPALFLIGWRLERSYYCDFCKHYHVTSQPRRAGKFAKEPE